MRDDGLIGLAGFLSPKVKVKVDPALLETAQGFQRTLETQTPQLLKTAGQFSQSVDRASRIADKSAARAEKMIPKVLLGVGVIAGIVMVGLIVREAVKN